MTNSLISYIPSVIFEDKESLAAIGQWLRVIPHHKVKSVIFTSPSDNCVATGAMYSPIGIKDTINSLYVSNELVELVSKRFGLILKSIGFDQTETYTIKQLNADKYLFNCHFKNATDDAKLQLSLGEFDMRDFPPEMTIEHNHENSIYEYQPNIDNQSVQLVYRSKK